MAFSTELVIANASMEPANLWKLLGNFCLCALLFLQLFLSVSGSVQLEFTFDYLFNDDGLLLTLESITSEGRIQDRTQLYFDPLPENVASGPYASLLTKLGALSDSPKVNLAYCINYLVRKASARTDDAIDYENFVKKSMPNVVRDIRFISRTYDSLIGKDAVNVFVLDTSLKSNYEDSVSFEKINRILLNMLDGKYPQRPRESLEKALVKINKDTSEVRRLRSVKTATDSFEREERENKEQMEVLSAFVRDRTISYVISESNVKCAFLTKLLTPQAKTLFLDKTKNAYVSTQLCVMGYLLSNVLLSGFQVRSSSTGESINGNSFVSFVNPSMEDSLATDPVLTSALLAQIRKRVTCTTFFEPGIYQSIYGKGSVFDKKVLLASEECIRRRIAADIEGTPVSSESEGDAYTRTILTYNSL